MGHHALSEARQVKLLELDRRVKVSQRGGQGGFDLGIEIAPLIQAQKSKLESISIYSLSIKVSQSIKAILNAIICISI